MSGRARAVAAALGALAVGGLVLGACTTTSSSEPEQGSAARHPLLADVATFALALGVDPSERSAQLRLGAHDLVVIDGDAATPDVVEALHADGAVVLAYLSAGTFEPYRSWFAEARDGDLLLDRWDDWGEWYADVERPEARRLIEREAARLLERGVDGLFLDNVDMVDTHPDQATAMVQLVADLDDLVGPERVLAAQNGDPIAQGIAAHLDAWNREDVSSTFDQEADGYVPVGAAERRAALDLVARVAAEGLLVTTTDYLPVVEPELEAEAAARSCAAGAIPFVSDLELTRLPDEPLRCP